MSLGASVRHDLMKSTAEEQWFTAQLSACCLVLVGAICREVSVEMSGHIRSEKVDHNAVRPW